MLSPRQLEAYLTLLETGGIRPFHVEEMLKSFICSTKNYKTDKDKKHLLIGCTAAPNGYLGPLAQIRESFSVSLETLLSIHTPLAFSYSGRKHFVAVKIVIDHDKRVILTSIHDSTSNPLGVKSPFGDSFLESLIRNELKQNTYYSNMTYQFESFNHGIQSSFSLFADQDKKCSIYSLAAALFSFLAAINTLSLSHQETTSIYKLVKNLSKKKAVTYFSTPMCDKEFCDAVTVAIVDISKAQVSKGQDIVEDQVNWLNLFGKIPEHCIDASTLLAQLIIESLYCNSSIQSSQLLFNIKQNYKRRLPGI